MDCICYFLVGGKKNRFYFLEYNVIMGSPSFTNEV